MKKYHSKVKRKFGLNTHKNHYFFFHQCIESKNRPKTFKTEESARNWAVKNNLEEGKYSLKRVKLNKRFQIVI